MNRRRATSTTSLSGSIERNMRYVTHLRRKIRSLEEEAAELTQRLSMLLADQEMNMTENNNLGNLQQEVEQQIQLQDALALRQHIPVEEERQSLDLVDSQPSTSQPTGQAEEGEEEEEEQPQGKKAKK